MGWPFKEEKTNTDPTNAETKEGGVGETKVEKTPAELIAESLKPLTEAVGKINDRLTHFEERVVTKPEREERTEREQPVSVLEDENVAFAQRLTPFVLRQFEIEARMVKTDVKQEYVSAGYGDLWNKYAAEIEDILGKTPLATGEGKPFRGDPQYIRNTVDMVFGRHAREAGLQFDGKSKGFFLETSTSGDGRSTSPEADGLNDGQRKLMQKMKISPEDAKKVMSKLTFVS